jgi:hypothetical protein
VIYFSYGNERSAERGNAMDYQIKPIAIEGFADANGVVENREGAWLGEVDGDQS